MRSDSDIDENETEVSRSFDTRRREAIILYSSGREEAAEKYVRGPRGMVETVFSDESIYELTLVPNELLTDGIISISMYPENLVTLNPWAFVCVCFCWFVSKCVCCSSVQIIFVFMQRVTFCCAPRICYFRCCYFSCSAKPPLAHGRNLMCFKDRWLGKKPHVL